MDFIFEGLDLKNNSLVNLEFYDEYLILEKGYEEGYIETAMMHIPKFTEISPSWNSRTNENSFVELLIRIRIEGQWTEYKSYGVWATDGLNRGINEAQSDEKIRFTEDRIFIKNNSYGDGVQVKVILRGENPKLKLMAVTTDAKDEDEEVYGNYLKILENVPRISQLISGHKDANCICSPTSLTMVLQYHKVDVDLFTVTKGVFDNSMKLYGNWPQNVAYAGELGMRAYTKKCASINDVKRLISKDIPVVASIVTTDKSQLEGTIMSYESGHLVTIIGFKYIDGEEYIVVNDPAAMSLEDVRRDYKLEEFINVWRTYIYVVNK